MDEELSMILIMGATGAGKSYFVNRVVADAVKEGSGLEAVQETCQAVRVDIGAYPILLVDAPGFDDTYRSDAEILDDILRFVISQHRCGIPLRGILYLYNINEVRMTGSSVRYLNIFRALCGTEALPNVVLVTTHWGDLKDVSVGYERDAQLRNRFWRAMVDNGSSIREFHGTRDQALGILMELVAKPCVELDVQKHLIRDKMPFAATPAGKLVMPVVGEDLADVEEEIAYCQSQIDGQSTTATTTPRGQTENGKTELYGGSAAEPPTEQRRKAERKRNVLRRLLQKFRSGDLVGQVDDTMHSTAAAFPWKDAIEIFASLVGVAVDVANVVLMF